MAAPTTVCDQREHQFMFMSSSPVTYLVVYVFTHRAQVLLHLLHGPFELIGAEGGLDLPPVSAKSRQANVHSQNVLRQLN